MNVHLCVSFESHFAAIYLEPFALPRELACVCNMGVQVSLPLSSHQDLLLQENASVKNLLTSQTKAVLKCIIS